MKVLFVKELFLLILNLEIVENVFRFFANITVPCKRQLKEKVSERKLSSIQTFENRKYSGKLS